jgi:hypothetical protein
MQTRPLLFAGAAIVAGAGCMPHVEAVVRGDRWGSVAASAGPGDGPSQFRVALLCQGPRGGHWMYGDWRNVNDGHPDQNLNGVMVWWSSAGPCAWDEIAAYVGAQP